MANNEPERTTPINLFRTLVNPTTLTLLIGCLAGFGVCVWLTHVMTNPEYWLPFWLFAIAISMVITIVAIHNDNDEIIVMHIVSGAILIFGAIISDGSDVKSEIVKYKPEHVFRTESKVLITYGDNEYSSTDIKTYNLPDSLIMICKEMSWDAWGDRNMDHTYVCDGKWSSNAPIGND